MHRHGQRPLSVFPFLFGGAFIEGDVVDESGGDIL